MSTAVDIMPVEEFVRDTSRPALEYFDGAVRRKSGPTKLHNLIEFVLQLLLRRQGWDVAHEVRVQLSPTHFLVPDAIVDRHIRGPFPTEAVHLCIEVLSPDDRLNDVIAKCRRYHEWGVPFCWIIDPEHESAWEVHGGAPLNAVDPLGTLRAGEIAVSAEEMFAEVRRLNAVNL